MKKEKRSFMNFGFSTILLFFVMICVVTFSVLSFTTAYSDYTLSKKVADKTIAYYATQELVCENLVNLEDFLWKHYQSTLNDTAYYEILQKELKLYGDVAHTDLGLTFTFQELISENQFLKVSLLLSYPEQDADTFYEILSWKTFYEQTILEEEEPLNLLQK